MKKIKVNTPIYDAKSGILRIKLSEESGAFSKVNIDFKTLIPFANLVDSQVRDFFAMTCAVYGIDRFVNRKQNSVDGWSRELQISFPVVDILEWNNVKEDLQDTLSFLTGDYWSINFYESDYFESMPKIIMPFNKNYKQVNLFSGGLDSLIGAVDFLSTHLNDKILFVSHYDPQMKGPKSDQEGLLIQLEKKFKDLYDFVPSVKVTLGETTSRRETTFRSRSILFLGIALLTSQGKKITEINVPENGSVSLNYPLSPSRRTSCSTRTTHAFVLDKTNLILSKLKIKSFISNPYDLRTKGQMVNECRDLEFLKEIISLSNSCGKRGHRAYWEEDKKSSSHCGICMPCIYRQASLMEITDTTTYGNDINNLPPFKKQKGYDVSILLDFLKKKLMKDEIKTELIVNGIKNLDKLDKYVDVVWNTRNELATWVDKNGNSIIKTKAGL